jgi:hypothetical protein
VRLSSTCPECLIHQTDERQRGEFRCSELKALETKFSALNTLLKEPMMKGGTNARLSTELRAWNSKRYICPKNLCQVHPEKLMHIPAAVKAEIERISKNEKEIHFLLEEVVRSSAFSSKAVSKCAVKVMAANALRSNVTAIVNHCRGRVQYKSSLFNHHNPTTSLLIKPFGLSSGVLVSVPPPSPERQDKTDEWALFDSGAQKTGFAHSSESNQPKLDMVVLTCEHIVTEATRKGSENFYSKKGAKEADQEYIFFVGGSLRSVFRSL